MAWRVMRAARMEKEERTQYSDWTLFKRTLSLFRYYIGETISVIAIVITASILSILLPIVVQRTLDYYIYPGNQMFQDEIVIMSGIYLGFIILNFFIMLARTIFFARLGQRIIYKLRNNVFNKLQDLGLDYYTKVESGRTISKVTNDVDSLGELLTSGIIDIFADFFSLIWIVVIMFTYDVGMTLMTFTVIPILIIVSFIFQKRVRKAYRKTRVAIAKVTANLQETITGVKVTRSLSREDKSIENFRDINNETFEANVEAAGISSFFMPLIQLISALGSTIIVLYGGYLAITTGRITYGELYIFLDYSSKFFAPIMSLFMFYTVIQSGFASAERIFEIMDEEPSIVNADNPIIPKAIKGHIKFENVCFRYEEDVPVLKDINLEIQPGESLALVGHTGAGKTTMTKLLSRYYDANQGRLLIDGIDIRNINLPTLRKNIAVVPQDVFLFSGTIMENLKYGKKQANDESVYRICKTLGLDDYILDLPDQYQTDVREGGSRLSLGQRQLLSLARAMIADPKILIMDESSSSVDPITEELIQKGIDELLKGRTSIIIAHRLSTIKNVSSIIVMDHGKIVERGTHQELINKEGAYYGLYSTQLTSNIIE